MNARVIPFTQAEPDDMTTPANVRTPPHSVEAEQNILGALLVDNSALPLVAAKLTEGAFYVHAHRLIFGAIVELCEEGGGADVITVFERLQRCGKDGDAGGLAQINALCASVVDARNVQRYIDIVAERAIERALIAGLDAASTIAWQSNESLETRIDRLADVVRQVERAKLGPMGRGVPLLGLEALQQSAEAVEWLVKRVVPADSVGMLFGGSGTFKTYLALDFALHVCHGLPWMGRKTRRGAVIYIAAEGGTGLWSRILAWHRARGLDWRRADLRVVPVAVDIAADAWRVVDAAQLAGVTPQLVVVDTLSQTFSGEENSASDMAVYLRTLGARFRSLWHCAVMVLHHSGHAATERPRGSSAILANVDFLLGVFRDEKEMLATLTCQKQKDGELFDDAVFQLRVQGLGEDADGDPITQLVARHLSGAEELGEAMASEGKAGRGGKNQLLLTLLQNGMGEQELRKAFYEDCELDSADARRQAYHRAKAWAMKAGFFDVSEGVVIVKTNAWKGR